MPNKMTEKEIDAALSGLPGWSVQEGSLVRRFPFHSYMDGIRFVEMVAVAAEARDHHPDLLVRYSDVTVFLRTHSADGLTARDVDSAKDISRIATQFACT